MYFTYLQWDIGDAFLMTFTEGVVDDHKATSGGSFANEEGRQVIKLNITGTQRSSAGLGIYWVVADSHRYSSGSFQF